MFIRRIMASVACAALAGQAQATDDAELQQIRDEITRLRSSYETRIAELEARLQQAEQHLQSSAPPAAAQPAAAGNSSSAFNPAISLILSGQYAHLSRDPTGFGITGVRLPTDVVSDIAPQRAFSLTETELGISANIDPMFAGALNFSIHPDDTVSTEEAYVQTTALGSGVTIKAGRYFSGIGYLNEQHAHAWDFIDAPLPYQAYLGGQFNDEGMQVRWLAPTDLFIEAGLEAGRGNRYPGNANTGNRAGANALYLHVGGDIGTEHNWRLGLSRLSASPRDRQWTAFDAAGSELAGSFSGTSRLWIADAIWKWAPNGNPYRTNFKLQGEYLRRTESGQQAAADALQSTAYSTTQSGWYLQGIYQWAPYWRAGLRSERLATGDFDPNRNSLVIDYQPSEFSRLRWQFSRDRSRSGAADNQIYLQYMMSLGAHGAHRF